MRAAAQLTDWSGMPVRVRSSDGLGCRLFVARRTVPLPARGALLGHRYALTDVAGQARRVDMDEACLGGNETATAFIVASLPLQLSAAVADAPGRQATHRCAAPPRRRSLTDCPAQHGGAIAPTTD